jgi:hypothetical protein
MQNHEEQFQTPPKDQEQQFHVNFDEDQNVTFITLDNNLYQPTTPLQVIKVNKSNIM